MNTTSNDATNAKSMLVLRRRSIRILTADELRGVHGGNNTPAPTTSATNVQTIGTSGTSVIRGGHNQSGTSVIRQGPSANPSGGKH
jgi:hypothetical protein